MNFDDIEKAADEFMKSLYDGIGKDITSKSVTRYGPVNASGRLLRSRQITKQDKLHQQLSINRYAYNLVYGRRPGTAPPVSAIREWLKEKGLDLNEYAVAKSIARKGTTIFQTYHGGDSGLFSDTINKEAVKEFADKVAVLFSAEVKSELINGFMQ